LEIMLPPAQVCGGPTFTTFYLFSLVNNKDTLKKKRWIPKMEKQP
jgi:hypothetical protein